MTRLDENTVKELLAGYGISRPPGIVAGSAEELSQGLGELAAPLYVKAQVPVGDRAAVGAVVAVADAASATDVASALFGRTFQGAVVRRVLVEESRAGAWTGYAAVKVDDERRARVVVLERDGGSGFDPSGAAPLLEIDSRPEAHQIRTALARRGHGGGELQHLTAFVERLCRAARDWSTYVIEVNPFVVGDDGTVTVLDAKAEVDDHSTALLPSGVPLEGEELSPRERRALETQLADHQGTLRYVQLIDEAEPPRPGFVGSHAVGGGESMIIMDALADCGLEATNYCDTSGSPSREKVATAAELIAGQGHISGYFFASCIANQPLSVTAGGLVDGFRASGWSGPTVLRIAGNEEEQAIEVLQAWAEEVPGPVGVFGRETDEWTAARALAAMLRGA